MSKENNVELKIPLANLSKEDSTKKDSQRNQDQPAEGDGLFDFTAPKDPRANPLPTQENTEKQKSPKPSPTPSPQSSSRSQSKQSLLAIPKLQTPIINSKSPKNSPHSAKPKTTPLQQSSTPTSSAPPSSKKTKKEDLLVEIEEEEEDKDEDETKKDEEENIDTIVQDLLSGARDPQTVKDESLPDTIASLRKVRDDHLFDHDVDLAQRADELAMTLHNQQIYSYKKQFQKEVEANILSRLENAQNEYNKMQQHCNRTIRLLKQKHRKDMEQLEEKQINELNKFVADWQTDKVTRKYKSASSNLRNLRNQSINMIITRRFDDLRQNDKIVKNLEQQEINEQFRQMSMGYDFQLHQLEEKHRTEKEILSAVIERKEADLQATADKEIEKAINRIKTLQNSLNNTQDVEKVWNLHHRNKKTPPPKMATTVKIPKSVVMSKITQFQLNTLDLPHLGDPRANSQHGFRRRMQAPVKLFK